MGSVRVEAARLFEQCADGLDEELRRERLLQERHGWVRPAAMKDVRARVRRHVQHWYCRTINRQPTAEFPAIHARHHHIGYHETQVWRRQVCQVQCLPAVTSLQNAVALSPQQLAHQPTQQILVLCDKDGDRALVYRMRLSHNRPRAQLVNGESSRLTCKIPARGMAPTPSTAPSGPTLTVERSPVPYVYLLSPPERRYLWRDAEARCCSAATVVEEAQ
jgi:hypothetical protein